MAIISAIVLSVTDAKSAMLALAHNFQGMMETALIPREVQAVIGNLPVTTIELFSQMGRDDDTFKDFVKLHLKIDPARGFTQLKAMGELTILWGHCKDRVKKESEAKASSAATGLPRHMPKQDYMSLVTKWVGATIPSRISSSCI